MYRGNSKSEHVTTTMSRSNHNNDGAGTLTSSSNHKIRLGRLKRSKSLDDDGDCGDGTPQPLYKVDGQKRGGKKSHSTTDYSSLESKRKPISWFRRQQMNEGNESLPDHKSLISERSKKSKGSGLFSRNRPPTKNHGTTTTNMDPKGECNNHNVPPIFYADGNDDNDNDDDCLSSFADDYTNRSEKSAPAAMSQTKKAGKQIQIFGKRHERSPPERNNLTNAKEDTASTNPKVRSVFHSKSNDTIVPLNRTPLRKNVSFGYDTTSAVDANPITIRTRCSSSDEHMVIKSIVPRENYSSEPDTIDRYDHEPDSFVENDYGYNTIDFPMPNRNSAQTQSDTSLNNEGTIQPSGKAISRERARYSVYHGNSKVKKKLRVRPYHCFPDEAVMMTEEEIYTESLNQSKDFVPLKSYLVPSTTQQSSDLVDTIPELVREMWGTPEMDGRIGSLRVEVLGCVGLNRSKPDTSVYIVCGDTAFCTDVLTGYRSPMWPSVSRRACLIPIHHAYAKLFIGVFDVKKRTNKENDVFCGRVAIDIACIRPNTEYDTTLPLRASTFVYDKRKRGVVRVRFSIHWFNERAAATSYLKPAKSLYDSCPLVDGQPTIPCADPKTFRNVAVTVYGQDLPGKYSKNAFRATVRELTLYQQNIRLVLKVMILDAMLYEEPWISMYLFISAMYCVFYNTVAMVPALTMGYIIILYIENYRRYVENSEFHFGYKPLTIFEVFKAVMFNKEKNVNKSFFRSITVEKKTKRRQGGRGVPLKADTQTDVDEDDGEIVLMDHREFPFSDRGAYPKFSVEESIAPGSNKGGTGRLHGRLSVYYTAEAKSPEEDGSIGEDHSDADSDNDDETVMTESQMIGDSLYDLDSDHDDDYEMNLEGTDYNYKLAVTAEPKGGVYDRRLRIGPPQDTDLSGGNKVPPQVQLKKVEALLHKFSRSISVEMVHEPPKLEKKDATDGIVSSGMTTPSRELQDKMSKKAKKVMYDDFDKLLGLQSRNANPVHRIMSSFIGPLMRMIRVAIFLMRISFNVSTWRDPYLSFWVLMMLSFLCFFLAFFPWRAFFLIASVACLGPQNIFVRKYLERRMAIKKEENVEDTFESNPSDQLVTEKFSVDKSSPTTKEKIEDKESDARRGFFAKRRNNATESRPTANQRTKTNVSKTNDFCSPMSRPAFCSDHHGQTSSSAKLQPRAVAIPYSRFKKERFYDWPPDPTVSRATPIVLNTEVTENDDSLSASIPDLPTPDHEEEEEEEDLLDSSLREDRKNEGKLPPDIPTVIMF